VTSKLKWREYVGMSAPTNLSSRQSERWSIYFRSVLAFGCLHAKRSIGVDAKTFFEHIICLRGVNSHISVIRYITVASSKQNMTLLCNK
jgi:hypothetical protein